MMTSRVMSWIFETRSSRRARPSGLRSALSKSKNVSAAKVTFSAFGAGTGGARVVVGGTAAVVVTQGDDDYEGHVLDLRDEVDQTRPAFGLEVGLVEIEERVGGEGDLLGLRRGHRSRGWRRGGSRRRRR